MRGFDEPSPYSIRSFTYRMEQARANKAQRVIVYNTFQTSYRCL